MRTLDDIRNNPAIMKHLRFDLTNEQLIVPKEEFDPKDAGFYFCIYAWWNNAKLILLHLYPNGTATQEAIENFPEDMVMDAITEAGGLIQGGYTGSERQGNVRKGRYYLINKPIEDVLRAGLLVAGMRKKKEGAK